MRATAIQANPLADIGVMGFTDRQLEQLRGIVRGELETLLTPLTANNVNTVNRLCPQCGGAVIGQSTKVYCSDPCRKKAFRQRAKTCLLYTSPSPRDRTRSRMPSSA